MRSFFFFLLIPFVCYGQQEKIGVPLRWNNLSFSAFADSLSQTQKVQIFYKVVWVEGIRVKVEQDGDELWKVLTNSLYGRGLYLTCTTPHTYLLTRGVPLRQQLSLQQQADTTLPAEKDQFTGSNKAPLVPEKVTDQRTTLYDIGKPDARAEGEAILSGSIYASGSGEPVVGATIYEAESMKGNISNALGNFSLKLSRGMHSLSVRCIGMKEIELTINLHSDGFLNLSMEEQLLELNPVVVSSKRYHNLEGAQMGFSRIDAKTISKIPVVGEADLLKLSLLFPGVQSVGEGTTGFNVRGGNADQNLILLENAPIFNPSHLMGFFSAINADIVREFELYKSNIPPGFGGRLSSVLDISLKNGNKTSFAGSGGISLLTGKMELEGPLIKDRCSFLLSGRSTYSNWLLHQIRNKEAANSDAAFSDLNAKIHLELPGQHSLSISAYLSRDLFSKNKKDTLFYYTNQLLSAEWNWKISPRFTMSNAAVYSSYYNSITDSAIQQQGYLADYRLDYYQHRTDFNYFYNNDHTLQYGLSNTLYSLQPGSLQPAGPFSRIHAVQLEAERALETAAYINEEYKGINRLLVNIGFRYSNYLFLGPVHSYHYQKGIPLESSTIIDTLAYKAGEIASWYKGLEPRVSFRLLLGNEYSLKAGYTRMRQYIHILSNTFSISPTDSWKLSDNKLVPQVSDQFTLGMYKNLKHGIYELSLELYSKKLEGLKDYKVAADIALNEHIETEIVNCRGKAFGAEFMLKKPAGKLNGWLSYTYSRIFEKTASRFREEQINGNNWFPASYDKPHSASAVMSYQFSRRVSISSDMVYSTGRPITYPVARYIYKGNTFVHYSERNEYRIPDYFRWDVSVNLDGNLRMTQAAHSFWSLSVYNLTGRNNVYSIYFTSQANSTQGYKLSIFSRPIVSLTYNFRF